ncbi:hypothetical protein Btru_056060 [Bulinus truncatus]|nr:hypothetical protein Btru_056060 [Bulinus truncatus]
MVRGRPRPGVVDEVGDWVVNSHSSPGDGARIGHELMVVSSSKWQFTSDDGLGCVVMSKAPTSLQSHVHQKPQHLYRVMSKDPNISAEPCPGPDIYRVMSKAPTSPQSHVQGPNISLQSHDSDRQSGNTENQGGYSEEGNGK